MAEEQVFCISRSALEKAGLLVQGGLVTGDLASLLKLEQSFIPRWLAEEEPAWKQLIPYQLFVCEGRLMVFQRGGGVGEQRLAGRLSVGIGGHINSDDAAGERLKTEELWEAARRERREELEVKGAVKETVVGLINDDSDEVGRVHIGLVLLCQVEREGDVLVHGEEDIHFRGWWTREEITRRREWFEKWSLLAVELMESGYGQVR